MRKQCKDCAASITGKYARYCADCRSVHRRKRKKYELTPGIIAYLKERYKGAPRERGRAVVLLAQRTNLPKWWIRKEAQKLGLGYPMKRRDWTPEEVAYLETHIGEWCVDRLAREMRRSVVSVALKIKRLHLSRRFRDGWFTLRDVENGLGTDHRQIYKWIQNGWLGAGKDGRIAGSSGKPFWKFSILQLRNFIWNHPTEFDLKKVDQVWFLALMEMCDQQALRSAA